MPSSRRSAAAASPFFESRDPRTTTMPSLPSSRAVSKSRPRLAPVMNATFPFSFSFLIFFLSFVVLRNFGASDLREPPIDEQFRSRNIAAVVGCEKQHSLRDLIRRAEAADWHSIRKHFSALLTCFRRSQQLIEPRRVDRPRAHRVHANAAIF